MPNTLTYFRVDGSWRDIEQPIPSTAGSITPQENDPSLYVDFFPGFQSGAVEGGLTLYVPDYEDRGDTELAIAPITARAINGTLRSITVGDPVGVELPANTTFLGFTVDDPLFYHVRYRNVTYGGALQRFSPFAFQAPTDNTGVRITKPSLVRYPYRGP